MSPFTSGWGWEDGVQEGDIITWITQLPFKHRDYFKRKTFTLSLEINLSVAHSWWMNVIMSSDMSLWLIQIGFRLIQISDLMIHGLVTNGTAKMCCLGLILALFYSTMVIKMILDDNWSCNKLFLIGLVEKCKVTINKIEVMPSFGWISDEYLLKGPKIAKMGT